MRTRVGIDGMGQVGRALLRVVNDYPDRAFEVVAVNDSGSVDGPVSLETLAHLLRHDPPSARPPGRIETGHNQLALDGRPVQVLSEPGPGTPPWADLGVDIVVDAAGGRTPDRAAAHLAAGARKVVLAGPGSAAQVTVAIGINEDDYEPSSHRVVANASGAAACAAAMITVLHRGFGIRRGLVTTVRGDTEVDDRPDALRRELGRSHPTPLAVIPRTSDVIRALDAATPELAGRLNGMALRVPMADASITDLTVQLNEVATPGQVNRAFAEAARGPLKSILRYATEPLISTDVVGDPASCVFDAGLTTTSGTMAKVLGWYDQLAGQAHRTVELVDLVARMLPEVRS